MLTRHFPVPDAVFRTPAGQPHCTYLVAYEGEAEDKNVWLAYYIAHHPPIMARFPGIRQIEISTRLDWCGFLPYPRVDFLQRNKVVFDSTGGADGGAELTGAARNARGFQEFPAVQRRQHAFSDAYADGASARRCRTMNSMARRRK